MMAGVAPAGAHGVPPHPAAPARSGAIGSASVVSAGLNVSAAVEQYITWVYEDLFGREPDPQGLATWSVALQRGTPRVGVANAITASDEFRSGLIADAYSTYLGRAPDPDGMRFWLGKMAAGWTISQMESGFLASNEFFHKAGGSNFDFVTQLYPVVLGRVATPYEIVRWANLMTPEVLPPGLTWGLSRAQVAMDFLLSTEHLTAVVDSYYTTLLGRHLDPSGQATWVGILQAGGRDENIIGGIVASDEYWNNTGAPVLLTLDHLVLSPATATVALGATLQYGAEGFDAGNGSIGDVTGITSFMVDGAPGCPGGMCTAAALGNHTITGVVGTATGTAQLAVAAP